jgi:hypothetical protein
MNWVSIAEVTVAIVLAEVILQCARAAWRATGHQASAQALG